MKEVRIEGAIVPDEDKWIYDWLGYDATCPGDVRKGIDEAAGDTITFTINSPGGEISAGSEIWYLINGYGSETTADIVGYACSAASYLAMGADRIRMAPSALMMIHPVSGSANGNHNALEKEAGVLRIADKAISNTYRIRTGKSSEEILKLMEAETWMDCEKAKELGFIDEIIGEEKEQNTGAAGMMPLYNGFGALLDESVKEKVRNAAGRPQICDDTVLVQSRLNILKMRRNEDYV